MGIPLLCAASLQLGWDFMGLYGQDAHDYFQKALAWSRWFTGGDAPTPILHPQGYPISGALIGFVIGGPLIALRALSILSLGVVTGSVLRTLIRSGAGDARAMPFTVIAVLGSPFLLRGAMLIMSDLYAATFCMLSFACAHATMRSAQNALLATILAGAAIGVRHAAAALMVPMLAVLVVRLLRGRSWGSLMAVGVGGIVAVLVARALPGGPSGFPDHPWLRDWSLLNFFRRSFTTMDGAAHHALPNLVHALLPFAHPGFLPIGALLLPFVGWRDLRQAPRATAAIMIGAYTLFMAGIPFQNDRFLLLEVPLVAVVLFPAFDRCLTWLRSRSIPLAPAFMMVLAGQLALFAFSMRSFVALARTERELALLVSTRPERTLYQFSLGPALATHHVPQQVIDLWSGPVETFEPGSLVLFNPSAFGTQWRGRDPVMNWERAIGQGVDTIAQRKDGWVLVRVR